MMWIVDVITHTNSKEGKILKEREKVENIY